MSKQKTDIKGPCHEICDRFSSNHIHERVRILRKGFEFAQIFVKKKITVILHFGCVSLF
jgi:hypothetical protein